jgi:hypothetical protein
MNWDDLAGVRQRIGTEISNAGRARNFAFGIPFDFSSIAAGATSSVTQKTTAGGAFVVYAATGILHSAGTSITDQRFTVAIAANDGQWQQSALPWFGTIGTAQAPFYFLFRPVVAPGTNLVVTVANSTASSAVASVVLHGYILQANRND